MNDTFNGPYLGELYSDREMVAMLVTLGGYSFRLIDWK